MMSRGVTRNPSLLPFMTVLLVQLRDVDDGVEDRADSDEDDRERERLAVRQAEEIEAAGEHPDADAEEEPAAVSVAAADGVDGVRGADGDEEQRPVAPQRPSFPDVDGVEKRRHADRQQDQPDHQLSGRKGLFGVHVRPPRARYGGVPPTSRAGRRTEERYR